MNQSNLLVMSMNKDSAKYISNLLHQFFLKKLIRLTLTFKYTKLYIKKELKQLRL